MENFGCTTPFGRHLDNICKDYVNSAFLRDVVNFFCEKTYKSFNIKECPYPCTFLKVNLQSKTLKSIESGFRGTLVKLQFNRFVKITETYVSYTDLSLIGELGGYIGLFLGFSVFGLCQTLSTYFQFLLRKVVRGTSSVSKMKENPIAIHQTRSLP